jgi:hypothetical protein
LVGCQNELFVGVENTIADFSPIRCTQGDRRALPKLILQMIVVAHGPLFPE